jgi:uncharacterized RDD family membrane protein YckC
MYCPKCGKETEQSGKFCQWCGAELAELPERPFPRKRVGIIKTEKFAGLGGRFLGGLIDLLFLVLFDLLAIVVIGIIAWFVARPDPVSETIRMLNQYYHHLPRTDAAGQVVNAVIPPQIIFSVFFFLILIPWIYFAYFYSSKNQGTLGNMAVRVAVTDMQGNRITFGRATLRFFAMYLCLFTIFIGFIIIALTKYKQGLHDKIAATLVFRQW